MGVIDNRIELRRTLSVLRDILRSTANRSAWHAATEALVGRPSGAMDQRVVYNLWQQVANLRQALGNLAEVDRELRRLADARRHHLANIDTAAGQILVEIERELALDALQPEK